MKMNEYWIRLHWINYVWVTFSTNRFCRSGPPNELATVKSLKNVNCLYNFGFSLDTTSDRQKKWNLPIQSLHNNNICEYGNYLKYSGHILENHFEKNRFFCSTQKRNPRKPPEASTIAHWFTFTWNMNIFIYSPSFMLFHDDLSWRRFVLSTLCVHIMIFR